MKKLLPFLLLLLPLLLGATRRYNFNSDWQIAIGDTPPRSVTLPRAFNEDEAFRLSIERLTDTVCTYTKRFRLPALQGRKAFIEFEGVRQAADIYLNGHHLGTHENGVMAFGYDLTPYLIDGENTITLRIDNNWDYRERSTGSKYQWSDRNFNANYGGIPKNVYLHITSPIYQTLPLYSSLQTEGTYIYATDINPRRHTARVTAQSEVRNETSRPATLRYRVTLTDPDGRRAGQFTSKKTTILPGQTTTLSASAKLKNLNFWSWGYGYLYDVTTELIDAATGTPIDSVVTRTGFRKTSFADGRITLNDRTLMVHGYAQRTSNEWPAVGISVPAWLSDYSNDLMVQSGGNLVRWMHITPWKQDIESCDRVGLIQAMPAGDAEKDRQGRQWEHRTELMRDAIIYNRNNPSILFYECGNFRISPDHMAEMKAIRDKYDPHGGRAIGSREMLDVPEAEYGGEMLYVNRSATRPMWSMEYCRDEGLRKYWDQYSYPFHPEGAGPLYKGADASDYNHNQDLFAVELVRRWYDYFLERPGSGNRTNSGGAKIIFSDTNTHYRGEENYRRSGVTDPMRIPKDGFYAHQIMWRDAWVDPSTPGVHIIGHWNYPPQTVKPVYVVANADSVELRLNGRTLGRGKRDYQFLFTFPDVQFEPGTLEAIAYDSTGRETCRHTLSTASAPARLTLSAIQNPQGFRADGADMALLEFQILDADGRRCPLDNRAVTFTVDGPAEWRGGIAQGPDNYILSQTLPVECGINRALLRSTTTPGTIRITARAEGLPDAHLTLTTLPVDTRDGLSTYIPSATLPGRLTLGPTPEGPSYTPRFDAVEIRSVEAGSNPDDLPKASDDNENTAWTSSGRLADSWIRFNLARPTAVSEILLKLSGWRKRSYPIEILADADASSPALSGGTVLWTGYTPKGLGYVHIPIDPTVKASSITIRMIGASTERDAFAITELAGGPANEMDTRPAKNHELSIVEIELLTPAK